MGCCANDDDDEDTRFPSVFCVTFHAVLALEPTY
jgi:hypothetical protein